MKRSAAPSVLGSSKKRATFSTPWSHMKDTKPSIDDTTRPSNPLMETAHQSTGEGSQQSVLQNALLSLRHQTDHTSSLVQQQQQQQPNDGSHITNVTSSNATTSASLSSVTSSSTSSFVSSSSSGVSKVHHQFTLPHVSSSFVSPLTSTSTPLIPQSTESSSSSSDPLTHYYKVMWCKMTKKKHKTWEGDAILITRGRSVTLKDMEGKGIGHGTGYKSSELSSLTDGSTLAIGGKQIEVMGVISEDEWQSGRCFQGQYVSTDTSTGSVASYGAKGINKGFQNPLRSNSTTTHSIKTDTSHYRPHFDPTANNALVLPRPSQNHQLKYNTRGLPVVDVVVDPHLSLKLRPHQRDGVIFLYECMMNMRDYNGSGAILADEMGLGKSLQCISLIWTLLKQGPYGGTAVMRRVVIITPGSLVKNWQREFQKWLGNERLKVYAASTDNRPEDFAKSPVYPVLLISYELFMKCYDSLSKVSFDMIICDEGHRLKNTGIKTFTLLSKLPTAKRIVLSGTPVQNDLMEFYAITEFCNPGLLGSQSAYRKIYEEPIVQSRQVEATEKEKEVGQKRAQELMRLISMFYLRRTQEINKKYLPPKVENIIFCRPTPLQVSLYNHLLSSPAVRSCLSHHVTHTVGGSPHLVCIGALKKLCNCPSLVYTSTDSQSHLYDGIRAHYPEGYDPTDCKVEDSGKLWVLAAMLEYLHSTSTEKVVVVSNYTQTLDILEKMCKLFSYSFLRLDGQTPSSKRHSIVERFNNKQLKDFVFLLSSKAGGVGLNLIGASRLILYDIDWNPANDVQAMARVWRDGQSRKVHIYRLLTTGTIEEKIFQRQVNKLSLSDVIDGDHSANNDHTSKHEHGNFSLEELQDLFSFDESSECLTHDHLNCNCQLESHNEDRDIPNEEEKENHEDSVNVSRLCSLGREVIKEKKLLSVDKLKEWRHISPPFRQIEDDLILHGSKNITFVIQNTINQ